MKCCTPKGLSPACCLTSLTSGPSADDVLVRTDAAQEATDAVAASAEMRCATNTLFHGNTTAV